MLIYFRGDQNSRSAVENVVFQICWKSSQKTLNPIEKLILVNGDVSKIMGPIGNKKDRPRSGNNKVSGQKSQMRENTKKLSSRH